MFAKHASNPVKTWMPIISHVLMIMAFLLKMGLEEDLNEKLMAHREKSQFNSVQALLKLMNRT